MHSSSTSGCGQWGRTARQSSYDMHGCSIVISRSRVSRRNARACPVVQAPLASQKMHDVGRDRCAHGVHALDVLGRIGADLDLDAAVAGRDVGGGAAAPSTSGAACETER